MYTPSEVPLIVFDVDGTLHYTPAISDGALKSSFDAMSSSHDPLSFEMTNEDRSSCIGITAEEFSEKYLSGFDDYSREKIIDMILSAEVEALSSGDGELFPDVLSTLDELKSRGYRLAVFSNALVPYFNAVLDNLYLRPRFEYALCHGEVSERPKDQMLAMIKEKLGVNKCAVVGDRYHDIMAARMNGDISLGASYGFGSDSEMHMADIILENFSGLLDIFGK